MNIINTTLNDVYIIENKIFGDERGWFSEVYRTRELRDVTGGLEFVQMNESYSVHNVLRGLHYQDPCPQGKLVRVVRGEVFDVAVDFRRDSPQFLKWFGTTLSADNHRQLWIPPGFAHGFYVTGAEAHFVYACTDCYAPHAEHCIYYADPLIGIEWPVGEGLEPQVSAKDLQGIKASSLLGEHVP